MIIILLTEVEELECKENCTNSLDDRRRDIVLVGCVCEFVMFCYRS